MQYYTGDSADNNFCKDLFYNECQLSKLGVGVGIILSLWIK